MRLLVFHEDTPTNKVLVALQDDATLDDLHRAIEVRLDVRPGAIAEHLDGVVDPVPHEVVVDRPRVRREQQRRSVEELGS